MSDESTAATGPDWIPKNPETAQRLAEIFALNSARWLYDVQVQFGHDEPAAAVLTVGITREQLAELIELLPSVRLAEDF